MKQDIFKLQQNVKRPYNLFDLSHDLKTSFQMGKLIPTLCLETLPGDKFRIQVNSLTRFMPLVSPTMHRFTITHHVFFVPRRITWSDWDDFISGKEELVPPYADSIDIAEGDLGDYFGLPIGMPATEKVSAFQAAAYDHIYHWYYQASLLNSSEPDMLSAGDNTTITAMYNAEPYSVAWEHDYFTAALPYGQYGSEEVVIPLAGLSDTSGLHGGHATLMHVKYATSSRPIIRDYTYPNDPMANESGLRTDASGYIQGASDTGIIDPNNSLYIHSDDWGTIADLRRAIKLNEFLELDARAGDRFDEQIYNRFGVRSRDARIQKPEYIGGSKSALVVSEVLSSAETIDFDSTDVISPIGSMAGHGVGITAGNSFNYFCEEWGDIICLTFVRPKTGYHQGLHRMFSREDRLDYYWHEFALIGEQAILTKELYAAGTQTSNDLEFGYVPRFSEYKFMNSRCSGKMHATLDHWHLIRQFSSAPTLNDDFVTCSPDTRIFADTSLSAHHIVAHIDFNIKVLRQMPKFANPTI